MNFRQIETFRAVMTTLSMTEAAARLHTSQPNVSRTLQRLQAEIGFALFRRVGLRLVPTPEAEAFFAEVQRSFAGLSELDRAAKLIGSIGGGVRVGASMGLSVGLLPRALQAFMRRRPDVSINIHTSDSSTVCKWVESGYCDVGLTAFVPGKPGLDTRRLFQQDCLCIVPAGHPLASRRQVRARDLAGEVFISLPPLDPMRADIDKAFNPDRRQLLLETAYTVTICQMVAAGLGVSIVPPFVWQAMHFPGVSALPFRPGIAASCFAVTATHRIAPALATEFLQCVTTVLAPPGRGDVR